MLRLRADREALTDLRRHVVSEIATISRGSAESAAFEDFMSALNRKPDDIKVVIEFAQLWSMASRR
jgi:hypothetical protein